MIFVFGPGEDSYYMNNGRQSCWRNIPSGLAMLLLNDIRCSPEKIVGLALFPDDGYFLSAINGMWAANNVPAAIQGRIKADVGGNRNVLWIHHDASDASRYLICGISTTGRAKLFHASLSAGFLTTTSTEMFNTATYAVMGCRSNWVLGFCDRMYSLLDDEDVRNMVTAPGKVIRDVSLSPYHTGLVFMEYTDGTINYRLPNAWHDAIRTVDVAGRVPQGAADSVIGQGDGYRGFVSYVAVEVGKDADKEIGGEIVLALSQAGG